MSQEPFAPTTKDEAQVAEITPIRGKSSSTGIAQQINSGQLTPEEALKKAESDWSNQQGRKFVLPNEAARVAAYYKACDERELFERNKQPFIFPGFTEAGDFYLSQGLTLVGAQSGKGKSTASANILAGMIREQANSTALVLSNEEATDSIINRTACILKERSFMDFYRGSLYLPYREEVLNCVQSVLKRVVVMNDVNWDSSCIEDVQTMLLGAAAQGVSLILIDYFQTINHSRDFPELEPYQVLKKFGTFIRDYGRRAPVPVIVMCQLNPKSSASEFQARVQNDKTIYNDAFNVVEIAPNDESKLTDFIIHKQRFGTSQGTKVSLIFNKGRYERQGGVGI